MGWNNLSNFDATGFCEAFLKHHIHTKTQMSNATEGKTAKTEVLAGFCKI